MYDKIEVGFQAFIEGVSEDFGAIRAVSPQRREVVVYVENGGDFVVPASAIREVTEEKVVFSYDQLDPKLQAAIAHAHEAEDPKF